ncbi:hypothetical protein [Actinocorallia sp. A-T 12471]|uniref:hypothetical protein n=1 Tax=Actinocorallia sp. A-T 12471 TaxID=3089813 RepID=UPI0029D2DBAA|nr:hypothetical protein [Actinocorallia sp. A-T 12471]MDX6738513.1 hypothetical protein [Actinocorallia sp. A-T 12471]
MSASPQPTPLSQVPHAETSLVEALWRYRVMSLVIIAVTAALTLIATQFLLGGATATGRFAVTDPTNKDSLQMGVVSGPSYATYTAQRAEFAKSGPVLQRAAEIIAAEGGPDHSLAMLRGAVSASTKADSGVVVVSVTASSMREGGEIVNGVIQAYRELTADGIKKQREKQLKALRTSIDDLVDQIAALPGQSGRQAESLNVTLQQQRTQESTLVTEMARADDGVQFVDEADLDARAPSELPRNGLIGLALGLLLACVVSFLRATDPVQFRRAKPQDRPWRAPNPRSPLAAAATAPPLPHQSGPSHPVAGDYRHGGPLSTTHDLHADIAAERSGPYQFDEPER